MKPKTDFIQLKLLWWQLWELKRNNNTMQKKEYSCPKCGNKHYEADEMRATGGAFAKIFDVQNKKFTTISCSQCGYTEFYKRTTSSFGNVVDFFTN